MFIVFTLLTESKLLIDRITRDGGVLTLFAIFFLVANLKMKLNSK
jgi:hypothetical protein